MINRYTDALRRAFSQVLLVGCLVLFHPLAIWGTPLRGITISCQTYGPEWASPEMEMALNDIAGLGANAFAIHPYAQISGDGTIRFSDDPAPETILRPARWAVEKHLRMMLVPHLAYWGSPFSWRGEIDFSKAEEWDRFFTGYTTWIVGLARICEQEHIPLLCIGLEYVHAVQQPERWREIIRQIRAVYHGKLTYGANWDTFQDVSFWDALDYVGILAYFPVCTIAQTDPSAEILRAGWKNWLTQLKAYSVKMGRPILFTELGYNESSLAAAHPWDYKTGGPNAVAIQRRALVVALQETGGADFLAGVFLWKWFPDLKNTHEENFDLRKPGPRGAIREVWGKPTPVVAGSHP